MSPFFLSSVSLHLEPRLLSTFNGRYLSVPVLTSRASLWLTRRLTVKGFQKVLLFSCLPVNTTRTTSFMDYRVDRPTTPLLFSPSKMVKFEVNQLQFTFETPCTPCYHDVVTPYRILSTSIKVLNISEFVCSLVCAIHHFNHIIYTHFKFMTHYY